MKRLLSLLFLLFASFSAAHADQPKAPTTQNKPNHEAASEAFKTWESENAPREAAEESKYGELWSKTLLLLIVVLLVLFVGTWYLKRFGGLKMKESDQNARIQLLEKRVISPKAVVYLLSIDGHKVALSETSAGIQVLQEIGRASKPFSLDTPPTKT